MILRLIPIHTRTLKQNNLRIFNQCLNLILEILRKLTIQLCSDNEDPYEITDRIFTDMFAANKASN